MVMTLPTHVSARNASEYDDAVGARSHLPTHVSARNASAAMLRRSITPHSQLMSPHGMHQWSASWSSRRSSPNSCLRTECIRGADVLRPVVDLPTHVSARNASGGRVRNGGELLLPTHVSARNASAIVLFRRHDQRLPTHVSARNASPLLSSIAMPRILPTHVSARNASDRRARVFGDA